RVALDLVERHQRLGRREQAVTHVVTRADPQHPVVKLGESRPRILAGPRRAPMGGTRAARGFRISTSTAAPQSTHLPERPESLLVAIVATSLHQPTRGEGQPRM